MLITTTTTNDVIVVRTTTGEKIEIKLLESTGSQARIGIDAPKEVEIEKHES